MGPSQSPAFRAECPNCGRRKKTSSSTKSDALNGPHLVVPDPPSMSQSHCDTFRRSVRIYRLLEVRPQLLICGSLPREKLISGDAAKLLRTSVTSKKRSVLQAFTNTMPYSLPLACCHPSKIVPTTNMRQVAWKLASLCCNMQPKDPCTFQHVCSFFFYPNATLLLNAEKHRPEYNEQHRTTSASSMRGIARLKATPLLFSHSCYRSKSRPANQAWETWCCGNS